MKVFFSGLAVAARRLGLDALAESAIAESVLCRLDVGMSEQEAIRMSIVDELRKRGAYHGKLKQAVEAGVIFQLREGGGDDDGIGNRTVRTGTPARRSGSMGRGNPGEDTTPPAA